ncbi:MAG: hypothetical protein M3Z04_11965 [Chloroflexota bacterium]|nr:hypothetical protein [Chloroflexota bacterium]
MTRDVPRYTQLSEFTPATGCAPVGVLAGWRQRQLTDCLRGPLRAILLALTDPVVV